MTMDATAPIALFTYNRPDLTLRTIQSLRENFGALDHDLHIFSDGPRDSSQEDSVQAVRELLKTVTGFRQVHIHQSIHNKGLAKSIIEGVSELLAKSETVIVLEDDMITSPYFLKYMTENLVRFRDNSEVISIHGYCYPIPPQKNSFFIRGADCWGWATWRRGWDFFETNGNSLLQQLETEGLTREFDFNNSYPYTQMLRDQIAGKNNSWAIRWYASAFLLGKLTLYPSQSLVQNIGFDGSGTHSGTGQGHNVNLPLEAPAPPGDVTEDVQARKLFESYFRSQQGLTHKLRGVMYRLWRRKP